MSTPVFTAWRKSSFSSGGGNCVEVSSDNRGGLIGVRDTKDRDGGTLVFTAAEWASFVDGVRHGEFDL